MEKPASPTSPHCGGIDCGYQWQPLHIEGWQLYIVYNIHANASFIKGFLAQIDETALTLRWVAIRNSRKSMKPSLSLETQLEFLIIAFDFIFLTIVTIICD